MCIHKKSRVSVVYSHICMYVCIIKENLEKRLHKIFSNLKDIFIHNEWLYENIPNQFIFMEIFAIANDTKKSSTAAVLKPSLIVCL